MHSKAKGCWPVIVAAGFLVLAGAPARAENSDKPAAATESAKPERHGRHHAHHSSRTEKHAAKASAADQKKADAAARKDDAPAGDGTGLPVAVANANAQMPAATNAGAPASQAGDGQPADQAAAPARNAAVVQTTAIDIASNADATLVAPDELNDLDRAATPDKPMIWKVLRPIPQTPYLTTQSSEDTWNQASMIGKIFIVMGGFLTLASAARMFVA
ncbi:MAG: hypothetical protein ACLP1D_20045 [Xanthobacteraceae bacterium]|jgi:hypothetical protein